MSEGEIRTLTPNLELMRSVQSERGRPAGNESELLCNHAIVGPNMQLQVAICPTGAFEDFFFFFLPQEEYVLD